MLDAFCNTHKKYLKPHLNVDRPLGNIYIINVLNRPSGTKQISKFIFLAFRDRMLH